MKSFKIALWFLVAPLLIAILNVSVHVPGAEAQQRASIFVGPASGTFTVGSTFTVSVFLNTGGSSVNAIETYLSFPPDKLQVVSPNTGQSIIQLWVNQPSYSNAEGLLKFQGAIPAPGINTSSGVISTVTFRVKSTGTATLKILDDSRVLLNDGRGTDILGQTTDGLYYLTLPPPAGPIVTSPTNPDQEKWYPVKTVVFRWAAAPSVEGFSYVLNGSPVDVPDEISEGLRENVVYKDLPDGNHYFHIKNFRAGFWGGVTDYAVKIDNTPPAAFKIDISPSNYTSRRQPIIDFVTTDETSGLDHYELKIVSLDRSPEGKTAYETSPFFIEANPPYHRSFEIGRYDVIVKAYDKAGNFYQATERLTIANPIFEIVRGEGVRFWGSSTLPWLYTWIIIIIAFALLGRLGHHVWILHREAERHLALGPHKHPLIFHKLEVLKEKLKEYGHIGGKHFGLLMLAVVLSWGFLAPSYSSAQSPLPFTQSGLSLEPPVVTLFPAFLSNDEILYIGGRASAPNAQVLIYLQHKESGSTLSQTAATDKTGAWFYSLPQFLNAGNYSVWTQLKIGEEMSPPSSRMELAVAPTAIQFGKNRLSYQELYLAFALLFGAGFVGLLGFIGYHFFHFRKKSRRLLEEIREAEEAVRRGFSVLRRDIEAELALVQKTKMERVLKTEEKFREEKLLKDLETISGFIGKEVWDIEKAEKEI